MRRRLLRLFSVSLVVVALALVTVPLWLGAALHSGGPRWGLKFRTYERIGYARFALNDVEFQRGNTRVTINRAESDTPLLWAWRHWLSTGGEVIAQDWTVEVKPSAAATTSAAALPPATALPSATAQTVDGWISLRAKLRQIAGALNRWLPTARAGAGSVRWRGGELTLSHAAWRRGVLTVDALHFGPVIANATLEIPAEADELRLNARTTDAAGAIAVKSHAAEVAGDVTWWEQKGTIAARFDAKGWLPAEASLQADAWSVPGARLKLGDLYATVRGRGRVDWRANAVHADIDAVGEPLAGKKAPPLEVKLRGQGDMQKFTAETLHVSLPGVAADLSSPVTVDRKGKFQEGAAKFQVQADLARQPWFAAKGIVTAEAQLVSDATKAPVVDFRFGARDVAVRELPPVSAEGRGRFDWPTIQIVAGEIIAGNDERLQVRGGWNFQTKEILQGAAEGKIRRATLARWLPAQPEFEIVSLKAEASGPLAGLKHAGTAQAAGLTLRGVKPLEVSLAWNGAGPAIEKLSVDAVAGATKLAAIASVDATSARISELDLSQKGGSQLRLARPATIHWRPTLRIEGLHLAGAESAMDVDLAWGESGRVAVAVRNFPSTLLTDVLALPGPVWRVTSLAVTGEWDRGPMTFSAVTGAEIELTEGRKALVNLAARGDKSGVRLEALRAAEGPQSIVNATGNVPISLTPGGKEFYAIDPRATMNVDAETTSNAAFWKEIEALTGLELLEPHVSVRVHGAWDQPQGMVSVKAERISVDPKKFKRPLPTLEALDVAVTGDREGVKLDHVSLRIEGQELSARGRLPIKTEDWSALIKDPLAVARRGADLGVEIADADVAVFARFLPSYLAPKGRLHVAMNYKSGALTGDLRLSDAATRPLGPLGVLQEIEADLRFAGTAVELKSVTAKSGGSEVKLSGKVELPASLMAGKREDRGAGAEQTEQPKFDLTMKGENLPFVRRTGLLLRGDLDLKLTSPEGGTPRLSGKVRLRDSLFLQDVRALLPRGVENRMRRPPYFAVENPPLDQWRLDIDVEGENFLRLRTTVFDGLASARFHLGGTLGEPVALGEATVEDGTIRLPFASFSVQTGHVTLPRDQPFEPQLWITGVARRYNYDLRMEISGPASAPVLSFSSTPPLEHGQLLLMVMTGEAPKNEVTFSDRQRMTRIGAFLGQSLLSSFGDSKNADRLNIAMGEKVSRQGRETYNIEYRLNDRWSATGEYDEFDEYNAGVKWRAFSTGGPPPDPAKDDKEKH